MVCWIADDEPLALQKLKLFLSQTEGVRVGREFADGTSLLAALLDTNEAPDLLITDIQMPGMTGIEVLERLPYRIPIIVTTAWERYALPSWTLNVTDYLLKPYSRQRLAQAIDKVRETLRLQQLDKTHPQNILTLKSEGLNVPVNLDEVTHIEAQGDYMRWTRLGQKSLLVAGTLSSLEDQLPEADFIRVHRSFIVNVNHIVSISPHGINLRGDAEVPIGRTYKDKIAQITNNFVAL